MIIIYILIGIFVRLITSVFPFLCCRIMSHQNRILSLFIRKLIGVKLSIEGEAGYLNERGNLIIANHLGYLDGIILSSLFPLIFVTKLQVKSWPVFGWMSRVGCTVFIDRSSRLKSAETIGAMEKLLENKINVLFFPEGTSTDGSRILNFIPAYFQSVLNSGASIIPITIQYTKINSKAVTLSNRDWVFWYGQVKFFKHLGRVLGLKGIEARILIHPKIDSALYNTKADGRKQLSEVSRQTISKDFIFLKAPCPKGTPLPIGRQSVPLVRQCSLVCRRKK